MDPKAVSENFTKWTERERAFIEACPYCPGKPSKVGHGDALYPYRQDYGYLWICPLCKAFVGCHHHTDRPKGSLANKELRTLRKDWNHTFTRGNLKLTYKIPPYVWDGGYVNIDITDQNGNNIRFPTTIPATKDATKNADCQITEVTCKTCESPMLRESQHTDECKQCGIARLSAEWAKSAEKIKAKEVLRDAKYKKKGFNYKAEIWIHAGGDDRQIVVYFQEKPTDAEVQAIIKKKRSRVTNDYRIEAIEEGKS